MSFKVTVEDDGTCVAVEERRQLFECSVAAAVRVEVRITPLEGWPPNFAGFDGLDKGRLRAQLDTGPVGAHAAHAFWNRHALGVVSA